MSTKNNGGPAFPAQFFDDRATGMTLRDYFATHASESDILVQREFMRSMNMAFNGIGVLPDGWITKARYMHADAMLKARQE